MQTKTYSAVIPTAIGTDFHINTSDFVNRNYVNAITVYAGGFSIAFDVADARALGSHLIAAADRYEQQIEALEILRRADEITEAWHADQ
jgi:hypothetical protein